jgi:signal transduction histidine kinase/CheY-like chemotaxis protein
MSESQTQRRNPAPPSAERVLHATKAENSMQPPRPVIDQSLLVEILETAIEIGEADGGDIRLINGYTGELDLIVQRGFPPEWERYWQSRPSELSVCKIAVEKKRPVLIDDIGNSPFFQTIPSLKRTKELGFNLLRSTPLVSRSGQCLGSLALFRKKTEPPSNRSDKLLELFARQAVDRIENAHTTIILRQNEERKAFLLNLADTLAPLKDHLSVERETCRMITEVLNVHHAYVVQLDDENDTAFIREDYAREADIPLKGAYSMSVFDWAIEKFRRNECNIVPDMMDRALVPEAYRKACVPLGILSIAAVPILRTERPVAALCVTHREPRAWLENEIILLREVAERFWNVHERIKAEKARELTHEAHQRAQRVEALGQLTSGITHDFNNLLMVLSVNLEIAEMHMTAQRGNIAIARAFDAVRQGAGLIRQMMTFSRPQVSKAEAININQRVMDVMHMLSQSIGEQIEITTSLAEPAWIASVEVGEFDDMLINLATNARDAMAKPGQIRIETANIFLRGERAKLLNLPDGPYICLSMRDDGAGMAPEIIRRAIEPFFTTKSVGKGSGLGLSSVYGFVRRSGGALDIKSTLGVGTTVSLYFPKSDARNRLLQADDQDAQFLQGQGEVLLLVEDHEQVLEASAERLRLLGYTVLVARNGHEGIEALERHDRIRLMVSDIVMPGKVSGYELAEWAKTHRPDVGVILVSGNLGGGAALSQQDRHRILLKPYCFTALAQALRDALDAPAGVA